MTAQCFYCGKKCKNLKAHTEAVHPGKKSKGMPQKQICTEPSIADQVIDAQLRAAMGCPEECDDIILEGFE